MHCRAQGAERQDQQSQVAPAAAREEGAVVPVAEVDGGLGRGVADEQVPDERQAGDGYHDRHLCRPKLAGEVPEVAR